MKEINPDKGYDDKNIFESSHLYSKTPIIYLLEYCDVINYEVKLDNMSYFGEGVCILFSKDKNRKNIIKCILNDNQNKLFLKYPYVKTLTGSYNFK